MRSARAWRRTLPRPASTGVAINALYDFWTPGTALSGVSRRPADSERVGKRAARDSDHASSPEEINQTALGYNPRERSWNYLEPWLGGEWRLRDIVDYQLIAMESCLYQAAVRREDLLRSFYRIGKRAVDAHDPVCLRHLGEPARSRAPRETARDAALRAGRDRPVQQRHSLRGGKAYPAGSYIIRMQQPYSSFAKTLLETAGLSRSAHVSRRTAEAALRRDRADAADADGCRCRHRAADISAADVTEADHFEFPPVSTGSAVRARHRSWRIVNRYLKAGKPRLARSGHRRLSSSSAAPAQTCVPFDAPRIGLYKSYVPSMDEGWTRWLLEQFGFAYTSVYNRDMQAGNLQRPLRRHRLPGSARRTRSIRATNRARCPSSTRAVSAMRARGLKQFAAKGGTSSF